MDSASTQNDMLDAMKDTAALFNEIEGTVAFFKRIQFLK